MAQPSSSAARVLPGRVIGLLREGISSPAAAPKPLAGNRPTIRFAFQEL